MAKPNVSIPIEEWMDNLRKDALAAEDCQQMMEIDPRTILFLLEDNG